MNKTTISLTTGLALFSMFFGSGNLVFPIAVGQQNPDYFFAASLGIIFTGVLVPFLGVWAMGLFQGNHDRFFNLFGKRAPFWFSLISLSLMGPFGVLARCLTVAHGSIELLWPQANLTATSLLLSAIIFALAKRKSHLVHTLGNILTPLLLLSIAALAYFGLRELQPITSLGLESFPAFKEGLFKGYQTMDLLAAFFFSHFIIEHLEETTKGQKELSTSRILLRASLMGGVLLALVYLVLVALGSHYSIQLNELPMQEMLGKIAFIALGNYAAPIVCAMVVLACMTTALVLTTLFADFLRSKICKEKISENQSLLATLAISFAVSTLDFEGIASFLGPILSFIYPALIIITLINIAHQLWGIKRYRWPVFLTLALKSYWLFLAL